MQKSTNFKEAMSCVRLSYGLIVLGILAALRPDWIAPICLGQICTMWFHEETQIYCDRNVFGLINLCISYWTGLIVGFMIRMILI